MKSDLVDSITKLVEALDRLVTTLGVAATISLIVALVLLKILWEWWKAYRTDKILNAALGAKQAQIDQINVQNREFRVQMLVLGGNFTKAEAIELVYQDPASRKDPKP